jgi:hypothetical protein
MCSKNNCIYVCVYIYIYGSRIHSKDQAKKGEKKFDKGSAYIGSTPITINLHKNGKYLPLITGFFKK